MKESLAAELADLYLDRDPTNVPDFDAAVRRAKMVIDIDPENVKARRFLMRATSYNVDLRMKGGERNFSGLHDEINGIRRHAEWLESRLGALPSELRDEVKGDLAGYYDQIGDIKDSEGTHEIGLANEAGGRVAQNYEGISRASNPRGHLGSLKSNLREHKQHIERTRECFGESDRAFQKSLQFQPANARAQREMEHHAKQYPTMNSLSRDIDDQLRQLAGI